MRDYTRIPAYADMPPAQARYNYMHDLLDEYRGISKDAKAPEDCSKCQVKEQRGGCEYCSFSGFLGGGADVCCNWRAEADPDRAIEILEELLKKKPPVEPVGDDWASKYRFIVSSLPMEGQMRIAQEECAELIQAISKYVRYGDKALDNLSEEMADVENCLHQLIRYLGNRVQVDEWLDRKLTRTVEKIQKGEIG